VGWSSLTALSEEIERGETSVSRKRHNLTITQRNDTKLLYKGELQREEEEGGRKWLGSPEQSGEILFWEIDCALFFFSFFFFSTIL
jgi:hypothetical protein